MLCFIAPSMIVGSNITLSTKDYNNPCAEIQVWVSLPGLRHGIIDAPAPISPIAIVPIGIELFNCDMAYLAYAIRNCATCNNLPMNNFSTKNHTHDLGSNTNCWIESLPLGQKLWPIVWVQIFLLKKVRTQASRFKCDLVHLTSTMGKLMPPGIVTRSMLNKA